MSAWPVFTRRKPLHRFKTVTMYASVRRGPCKGRSGESERHRANRVAYKMAPLLALHTSVCTRAICRPVRVPLSLLNRYRVTSVHIVVRIRIV